MIATSRALSKGRRVYCATRIGCTQRPRPGPRRIWAVPYSQVPVGLGGRRRDTIGDTQADRSVSYVPLRADSWPPADNPRLVADPARCRGAGGSRGETPDGV